MRRALISSENALWRNILGVLAAIVIVPIVTIIKLILLPFERPVKRSADEVVKYLQDFIEGTGDDWDWDDFTSIQIDDPQLEAIRIRAANIEFPVCEKGLDALRALLSEARTLCSFTSEEV